ncbi:MAG: hypothetical protein ACFFCS_17385 [Candidatus Hodarchaeota archaeon]
MPRLMVIYKIQPGKFDLAIKRWTAMTDPDGPPELKEALSKCDIETMEVAAGLGFIMAVFTVKDEDMKYPQMLALHLGDAFDMEVHPVLAVDEQTQALELFKKLKR